MPRWLRLLLFVLAPPLAVAEKGVWAIASTVIAMLVFPLAGHVVAALWLVYGTQPPRKREQLRRADAPSDDDDRRYIRLADGEWVEVVDTEQHEAEERRRRHQ